MDRIIEVKINGNYLTKDNNLAGVQGEANVTALRIEFDAGWDGFAKTVTFLDALGQNPVKRTLTADLLEDITKSTRIYLCLIPGEPLRECGWCSFVIDGYADGKRQRSLEENLLVKSASVTDSAAEPVDPTPTQAEQLQKQIDTVLGDMQEQAVIAHDAATEAANSALSASDSATFAGESAEGAAASERAALEASESAEGSAREAESSRIAARASRDDAQAAAEVANTAAGLAEDLAAQTKTYRDEAQNAADSAYGSRVAAAESASAAASSANTAKNSANVATNRATAAYESAESANNSAASAAASAKEAQRAADNAAGAAVESVEIRLSDYVEDAETARDGAESAQKAAEKARDEAQAIAGGDFATTSYVDNKVDDITDSVEERLGNLTEADISHGSEDSWQDAMPPFSRAQVKRSRANRFALLPADNILIERSVDGGATWTVPDYGWGHKVNLFTNDVSEGTFQISPNLSLDDRLRITITAPPNARCNLDQIYTLITRRGHSVRLTIEGALTSAPDTFTVLRNSVSLSGWSGPNMVNIPPIRWGGAGVAADYVKLRFTYRPTGINTSQTGKPAVMAIYGYGEFAWYMHHSLALDDCLYTVDHNGDATFPANLTAKTIAGVTPTEIGYLGGLTGNIQEQLADKLPTTGGIITGPLAFSGGDRATSGKLVLNPANGSQITDNSTSTLFGFTGNGTNNLTVGNSAYNLVMRGTASRPTYNAAHMAMLSDVEEATNAVQTQLNGKWDLSKIGTSLSSYTDLHDVKTPGKYYATASQAQALANCPVGYGFELVVLQGYTSDRIHHLLFPGNSIGNLYYASFFGEWSRYFNLSETKLTDLGITATADELNYMSGATGKVQTQLDGKANQVSLGRTRTDSVYTVFAKLAVAHNNQNDSATLLVSDGGHGRKLGGAWLVQIGNYPEANMTVRELLPAGTNPPQFGCYTDGAYFCFGLYTGPYRLSPCVTVLNNINALVEDFGDSTTKPETWVDVATERFASTLDDLGITATADELNYMDGATSNVQDQLNALNEETAALQTQVNAKVEAVTGTITTTSSTGGSGITGSATLPGTPKMVFIQFIDNFGNTNNLTPIMAPVSGKYVTYGGHEAYESVISYEIKVTIDGTNLRVDWYSSMKCSCSYTAFL